MNIKRILCFFIMLSVLLSLAACGGQSDVVSDGQWHGKGGCYKLDRLSEGNYSAIKGCPEHLICSNDISDRLCSTDGSILYNGYVHDYAVAEDGVWFVRDKGMVDGEYIQDCYVGKTGFDGQELARFDVPIKGCSLAVVSGSVYIYDAVNKELEVYSTDGTPQGSIDLGGAQIDDFAAKLCTGGDGSVWLYSDLKTGKLLYPVSLSAKNVGTAYKLPEDTVSLSTGTAEHIFLLETEKEFSYLDPAAGTTANILYWEECGIHNGELSSFIPDGDGFLCLSVTGLCRLSPAKPEDIHPKTRLTLGVVTKYDGSSELAARFNAMSSDYYVDIIDYSNDDELKPEEALVKLNTELTGGEGPDMVVVSDTGDLQSTSAYADMYPMIDKDTELDREDFYGLKAIETGGKLLLAPSRLEVSTFGALPKVAAGRMGWTWDEYFNKKSKLPSGGVMYSYLSADFFLKNSLDLYAPQAIDWANGTCNFDTPEFVRILKAAKEGYDPNCPEENPYFIDEVRTMMANGRMILEEAGFFDAESFARSESLTGQLDYIGWPTPDGSCGSVFHVAGVSISAATKCQEGCWEFAKYVLKSTYAYKPTFEKAISEATAANSTAEGEQAPVLTAAQAARYKTLMESITVAVSYNSKISDIVLDEAEAMFAGVKTPEETAKNIQSKLSIYVAEHK